MAGKPVGRRLSSEILAWPPVALLAADRERWLTNRAAETTYPKTKHLERSQARLALARAHLLYGEWLRREGRRADSRGHLRTAYEMLAPIGAEAFAARAARELAATGERVKKRTVHTRDDLTAQEAQIARLAAEGYSNRQIGEQLFISHRTVGYHLHKVFSKLDISNRAQLHGSLDSDQIEVTRSLGTSGTAAP